jgi:hypothetical protein
MNTVEQLRSGDGRNGNVLSGIASDLILEIELIALPSDQYA